MPARRGRPPKSAKEMVTIQARYDAAGNGRRMKGWNAPSTGPNKAMANLAVLRNRTRDAARNDWSGESAIRSWTTNLIGVGIVPRFPKIASRTRRTDIADLFRRWTYECDADNVLDFYGQQTLVVRSWLEAGEVFGRIRHRRPEGGMEVPFQVQLIEADFCPIFDADTWPEMPQGHRIRSGIELGRTGQRVAYWFYREHPGEGAMNSSPDATKLIRVAASEVMHVFEPKRPGQLRGATPLAPVLARLRNVNDFDDAVLERQKLANLFTMFITRPAPPEGSESVDPLTGQAYSTSPDGPVASLMPGMSQELLPGEDVKFANPPEAGTTYSDYMRTQHMGTSAGVGVPYEIFSGDIKEVSDRTLRVLINEFRRFAEQRQWQIIIPMFCRKVMKAFAEKAALMGLINQTEMVAVADATWSPHGWQYIHPVQDVQGKALEVESGFRSRSSVIGERGDDPEQVDDERAQDIERETEMGLRLEQPVDDGGDDDLGDEDGIDDNEYSAPPNPNVLMEALNRIEVGMSNRPEPKPAEPVNVVINNHIPQTLVQNSIEPTPVEVHVDNKVDVPTPDVNVSVAAPEVTVAAPTVTVQNEVQPAEVTVKLPARKTETTVERDSKGNIVKSTQIETDA